MFRYVVQILNQLTLAQWGELVAIVAAIYLWDRLLNILIPMKDRESTMTIQLTYSLLQVSAALILWSTLCLRIPNATHQANFVPMWSWYQGFFLGIDEIRWQIYFNIMLFVPFGCLLYLHKARSLSKSLLQGFLLSVVIELCQLLFKLGLFEWDDMLHNTLGCMLGGFSAKTIERVWDLHRLHKTAGRK